MNYGPTKIANQLHRTQSNLLLFVTDDDNLNVMRASDDLYPYSTNFAGLPELTYKPTKTTIQFDNDNNIK